MTLYNHTYLGVTKAISLTKTFLPRNAFAEKVRHKLCRIKCTKGIRLPATGEDLMDLTRVSMFVYSAHKHTYSFTKGG